MTNHSVTQLWEKFKLDSPNAPHSYDVWAFGSSKKEADKLATLVCKEIKTATSSVHALYHPETQLPYSGLHNVILDGKENAVAIIETTIVDIVPFGEVSKEHAYLEGEGDRSLERWRVVHEPFFKSELKDTKHTFTDQTLVVCEQFKLVFKA